MKTKINNKNINDVIQKASRKYTLLQPHIYTLFNPLDGKIDIYYKDCLFSQVTYGYTTEQVENIIMAFCRGYHTGGFKL